MPPHPKEPSVHTPASPASPGSPAHRPHSPAGGNMESGRNHLHLGSEAEQPPKTTVLQTILQVQGPAALPNSLSLPKY